MPLEDVGTVKALLRSRSTAWAKATDHSALVVSESVPVLVVLPRESLDVVLAGGDWALLRALVLVCEHVGLQVLEHASTFWQGTHALLHRLVIQVVAASTATASACAGVVRVQ